MPHAAPILLFLVLAIASPLFRFVARPATRQRHWHLSSLAGAGLFLVIATSVVRFAVHRADGRADPLP